MKQLKVLTLVGTRPEIIRLSRVMAALDASPAIQHIIAHTGQNYDYELNQVFFDDLEIRKPDHFLEAAGRNASETIGQTIIKVDEVLETEQPDVLLVLGDTNSCLGTIPAKKRHIPIFHMEAGNRCFDQRVPEETNRKIVDHISDINLTYSDIAREYLLREGLPADRVIKTGSPMNEVLHYYLSKSTTSSVLDELGIKKSQYFVVSAHREENVNNKDRFDALLQILNELVDQYGFPVIVSTHPRTREVLKSNPRVLSDKIRFMKPFGFSDYIKLQMQAKAVFSDSGTISEESSILNFPAINIREAHERPEAMEEASVPMTGLNPERVFQALSVVLDQGRGNDRKLRQVSDYSMPNVSEKVVRIILSYTDYVKRVVWFGE